MSPQIDHFEGGEERTTQEVELTGGFKRNLVTVYSRHGCHLCDIAIETLTILQNELGFDLAELYIDDDRELEKKYGEQVPVILIDGEPHDFWRLDPERFKSSLERHRQRR
jgi:glutaredoxin